MKEKFWWLKGKLDAYGSVGHLTYCEGKPIGFIEYVSAEDAPYPSRTRGTLPSSRASTW